MDSPGRWRILLLDTKRSNPNHYLCLGLEHALRAHPEVATVFKADLGNALVTARTQGCNLFIAFDGEELHRGICARLAAQCGRSLLWVTEDPYEIPFNLENARIFDRVFTNDSATVHRYGDKGRHLPLAADPDLHFLPVQEDEQCLYDLFFAGTAWPNRVALIKQMLDRIQGLKTKLVLPHNEHLPPPSRTLDLPESAYSWRMSNAQFVRFANRSRVVLSLHRVFTASPGGAPMAATPGPRLFEVALAGGFQLVDLSLEETVRYFQEDQEFVGFRTPAEGVDKLQYYLAHPEERLAIARAAQTKAAAAHTYAQRVDRLLAEAAAIPEPAVTEISSVADSPLRVLHVTHNIIGVVPFGGIEIYQDLVRRQLGGEANGRGRRFEFFFYVPDNTGHSRSARLLNERYEVLEEINFPVVATQEMLTEPGREKAFAGILAKYRIDAVHYQHFIGHVPSLPFISRALGIAAMISLHDYYTMCWQFNLVDMTGKFCAPEGLTETACDLCIGTTRHGLPSSQSCRRGFYGRMLEQVDIIHCNTDEVARRYRAVYPQLARHPGLIARSVPIPDGPQLTPATREQPMRVVLLGNFSPNKGSDFLFRLFSLMRDEPICFDVLGTIDHRIEADVRALNLPNVILRGGYAPGTQGALMAGASVALFASIWPETYCLSLSEAWQAGLVPVAPDVGAFAERIEHGVSGFKYPMGQLGALIDILRLLAHDDTLIRQIGAGLGPHLYGTATEHGHWLADTYAGLAARGARYRGGEPWVERAEPTLAECGVVLTHPSWLRAAPPPAAAPAGAPAEVVMQLPAAIQPPVGPYQRTLRYLQHHGLRATVRRVVQEFRFRAGR